MSKLTKAEKDTINEWNRLMIQLVQYDKPKCKVIKLHKDKK
tara:strand:- start:8583 stop:8705 length:123 start_codon:yes stop_codon:yes gene_type:complete